MNEKSKEGVLLEGGDRDPFSEKCFLPETKPKGGERGSHSDSGEDKGSHINVSDFEDDNGSHVNVPDSEEQEGSHIIVPDSEEQKGSHVIVPDSEDDIDYRHVYVSDSEGEDTHFCVSEIIAETSIAPDIDETEVCLSGVISSALDIHKTGVCLSGVLCTRHLVSVNQKSV